MLLDLLRAGQRVRFVARGSSMWPAVRDGALVEVTPCGASTLRPGDLGAYASVQGRLVVHRVVRVEGGSVGFAGDALPAPDAPVATGSVLGRATVVQQPPMHLRWPTLFHLRPVLRRMREWLGTAPPQKR